MPADLTTDNEKNEWIFQQAAILAIVGSAER